MKFAHFYPLIYQHFQCKLYHIYEAHQIYSFVAALISLSKENFAFLWGMDYDKIMLKEGHKAVRLIIEGRVQGVWFRNWAVEEAANLNLDGWVRNRADGSVEALLVGPEGQVDQMIRHCHQGPKLARVKKVKLIPAQGITPKGFVRKPTVDVAARRGGDATE